VARLGNYLTSEPSSSGRTSLFISYLFIREEEEEEEEYMLIHIWYYMDLLPLPIKRVDRTSKTAIAN